MDTILMSQPDLSSEYFSVYEYSVSYYDYIVTDDCSGFGWNLENRTYDSLKQKLLYTDTGVILTLIFQPLCALFGVIGNAAFIYIVWKVPYMRTNMNIMLMNLALADMIYLTVGSVEKATNLVLSPVLYDNQFLGVTGSCWLIIPLIQVVSFASLLLIALLSVERYMAICKPLRHMRISTRARTLTNVALVWLTAVVVAAAILPSHIDSLPVCIIWPNLTIYDNFPRSASFCSTKSVTYYPVTEILQIVPFFVALILSVSCYVMIIWKLYRRTSPSGEIDTARRQRKSANAAARMILINGCAFFVLTTPFHVINGIQFLELIYPTWQRYDDTPKVVSGFLLYLNSAVNPYIYGLTNPMYRKAYGSLLCKFQFRKPQQSDCSRTRDTSLSIGNLSMEVLP